MSRCPITRVAAGKAGHPPCRRRLSCRKKGHLSRRERDTRSFRWSGPAQVCIPGQVTLVPLLATVLEPSLVFESRFEPSHRATIVNTGRWHHVNDPQKRNGISCGRRGGDHRPSRQRRDTAPEWQFEGKITRIRGTVSLAIVDAISSNRRRLFPLFLGRSENGLKLLV